MVQFLRDEVWGFLVYFFTPTQERMAVLGIALFFGFLIGIILLGTFVDILFVAIPVGVLALGGFFFYWMSIGPDS